MVDIAKIAYRPFTAPVPDILNVVLELALVDHDLCVHAHLQHLDRALVISGMILRR